MHKCIIVLRSFFFHDIERRLQSPNQVRTYKQHTSSSIRKREMRINDRAILESRVRVAITNTPPALSRERSCPGFTAAELQCSKNMPSEDHGLGWGLVKIFWQSSETNPMRGCPSPVLGNFPGVLNILRAAAIAE